MKKRAAGIVAGVLQIVLGFVVSASAAPVATQPATAPATRPATMPAALPVTLAGYSDEGTFFIFKNEERLVTLEFTWKAEGTFENKSTIEMGGQTVTQRLQVEPDNDGRWKKITQDTPLGPLTLERDGSVATRKLNERVDTINMKPETVLFENMSPALMSLAVRHYDQAKGGKQTFPIFIVPIGVFDAALERLDRVTRSIDGREVMFTRYTYGAPGVDLTVWVDDKDRVCLAEVPAQHAAYVRKGFEALRAAPATTTAPAADGSAAEFEVKVETDVGVPMRDGIKLATDIYRPVGEARVPVILVRTPYKKEMVELQARYYARRGYAFAIQDCRGRFSSPGTWEPFVHEAQDGYDTIEWLAAQSWSTGKIGMIGASYLGWVQWWAASENPPHLTTIIPNVSPPDPFHNIPYEYGAFMLLGSIWWADILESNATGDLSGRAISKIGEKKYGRLLRSLPVIDLDKAVLEKENPYWRKWIQHPVNDEYWAPANFLDRLQNVQIPVFHQSGWFDGDGIGTKLNYLKMASYGHRHQKLVLGPWGHTSEAHRMIGDRDFGPEAIVDLQSQYLRWLDHWLKGTNNGIADEPLVSLFVMGANKWLHGSVYPLPQTRFEKWYLVSGGQANTSPGDGRLTRVAPPPDSPPERFTYDPGDPTPNPDFSEEEDEPNAPTKSVEAKKKEAEAHHQQVTDARRDILVYVTEPLKEPLTIAGPVSAVLYAATSARDTDWFMRLMEVDEDGKVFPLVEGKIRARYRESTKKPEFLEPGKVYEYQLDLWHTGIQIPAGRRLRVEVASASFPYFSRNLNTGGHNEVETEFVAAEQTVYHNAQYPSHVLLPVIPGDDGP
jgi:putative CocE/NonD family hydrolase